MIDASSFLKSNPYGGFGGQFQQPQQPMQPDSSQPFKNLRQFPQQAKQNVIDWGTYDKTLAQQQGHPEMLRQYPYMLRWLYGQGAGQDQGGTSNVVPFGMNF